MENEQERAYQQVTANFRRVNHDTVEIRAFSAMMNLRWALILTLLIATVMSLFAMTADSIRHQKPVLHGGLFAYLVEDVQWVICIDCQLKEQYKRYYERQQKRYKNAEKYPFPVDSPETYEEYKQDFQSHVKRAKTVLLWHLPLLLILLWPSARGVRFDRRRRLVYGWRWGRLYAAPVLPGLYPLAALNPDDHHARLNCLWPLTLYRPGHSHGCFFGYWKWQLGFFPSVRSRQRRDMLVLMHDFMTTPEPDWLPLVKSRPRHVHWLGRLLNISFLPALPFPGKRLTAALDHYQHWWQALSPEQQADWLARCKLALLKRERRNASASLIFILVCLSLIGLIYLSVKMGW